MLGTGWLTIRQAQEALKNGRLEEAHRLLGQSAAQGHARSWQLLQQVAVGFVQRGERHLRQGEPEAAWNDLLLAEQVGLADDTTAIHLRQELTKLGLVEVRGMLEAGDPARAVKAAALLRERSVRQNERQMLECVSRDWVQARDQADRGEFTPAEQTVERLRRLLPELVAVQRFQQELLRRREVCTQALVQLHEAVDGSNWRRAVELADQVLAVAPQQTEARKARARAWKVIEPSTVGTGARPAAVPATVPAAKSGTLDRFLLWIDGIGGYLVCLTNRVTLGQATPDAAVDVPFYADISRVHATLTRDAGSYLLEGGRPIQVNGQATATAALQPGDRITLGTACQLQFTQPVPVSATARLDITSGHRLALAVDAVLLMADTLVLGPTTQAHVVIPDLPQQLVLFRQKTGLGIRYGAGFTVDGQKCQDRSNLGPNSRVVIDEVCFAVEHLMAAGFSLR